MLIMLKLRDVQKVICWKVYNDYEAYMYTSKQKNSIIVSRDYDNIKVKLP